VFPEIASCRSLCGDLPSDAKLETIIANAQVEQHFVTLLTRFAAANSGSSMRVRRIMLLAEPPSIDAGEMTDKGSINQRAVLNRRAALVAEMYCPSPTARVIAIEERS
jgi:feruloyl-CoA synthase